MEETTVGVHSKRNTHHPITPFIWVNYDISLIWIKAFSGDQEGRPRSICKRVALAAIQKRN